MKRLGESKKGRCLNLMCENRWKSRWQVTDLFVDYIFWSPVIVTGRGSKGGKMQENGGSGVFLHHLRQGDALTTGPNPLWLLVSRVWLAPYLGCGHGNESETGIGISHSVPLFFLKGTDLECALGRVKNVKKKNKICIFKKCELGWVGVPPERKATSPEPRDGNSLLDWPSPSSVI